MATNRAIDHKSGNSLDNRRSNLRYATHQENGRNSRRHRSGRLPYKGIYFCKKRQKYRARIKIGDKHCDLGFFDNPISAALAYDRGARTAFGEFARCNFEVQ